MAQRRFDAFISYGSDDLAVARALQRGLRRVAKPWWRRHALHVAQYESSFGAHPDLPAQIRDHLDQSDRLVLLASPVAATSRWVDQELIYWLDRRSIDEIVLVAVDGRFPWEDTSVGPINLPPSLVEAWASEPNVVDLRPVGSLDPEDPGFRAAIRKTVAGITGRPVEDVESDDLSQHRRTIRVAGAAVAGLSILAVATATGAGVATQQRSLAIGARDDAQAAQGDAEVARDEAEAAQIEAERQAAIAQSRALAGAALDQISAEPDLAMLLAAEADAVARTPEATEAMVRVLQATDAVTAVHRLPEEIPGGFNFSAAVASDNGRTVALSWAVTLDEIMAESADPRVLVWDSAAESSPRVVRLPTGLASTLLLSNDGRYLAADSIQCNQLWDLDRDIPLIEVTDAEFRFSPDQSEVLAVSGASIELWDLDGTRRWGVGAPITAEECEFHPDGSTATRTGTSAIPPPDPLPAYLADGSAIVAEGTDGLILIDVATGEVTALGEQVVEARPTADGGVLAVVGGTLRPLLATGPGAELLPVGDGARYDGAGSAIVVLDPEGRIRARVGDETPEPVEIGQPVEPVDVQVTSSGAHWVASWRLGGARWFAAGTTSPFAVTADGLGGVTALSDSGRLLVAGRADLDLGDEVVWPPITPRSIFLDSGQAAALPAERVTASSPNGRYHLIGDRMVDLEDGCSARSGTCEIVPVESDDDHWVITNTGLVHQIVGSRLVVVVDIGRRSQVGVQPLPGQVPSPTLDRSIDWGDDGSARLIDRDGKPVAEIEPPPGATGAVTRARWSADGSQVSIGWPGAIGTFDADGRSLSVVTPPLPRRTEYPATPEWLIDRHQASVMSRSDPGNQVRRFHLFDPTTGAELRQVDFLVDERPNEIDYHAESDRVAAIWSDEGLVRVWDGDEVLWEYRYAAAPDGGDASIRFSVDGSIVAAGLRADRTAILDADTGSEQLRLPVSRSPVFSPDGEMILLGDSLFSLETGQQLRQEFETDSRGFSADGDTLLVALGGPLAPGPLGALPIRGDGLRDRLCQQAGRSLSTAEVDRWLTADPVGC